MSEAWEKYYTRDQLTVLQRIEKENLKTFISVCEAMNLSYVVYGGTLLGAELYQDIIPWDDDIDVAMPREDYMKFIAYAKEYLPQDCFIQSPYDCPLCPYSYAKLRRRGTKFVEYANRNVKIETGVYIDIYPIDRIPDDEKARKRQFKRVRFWQLIYVIRQVPLYDKKAENIKGHILNLAKWVLCTLAKVLSQKFCIQKIDESMTKYNQTENGRYAVLTSPKYNNIYLHLFPFEDGKFGNIDVKIPGDSKTHLRMRYGDFERVLSEDERIGHIPYELDLGEWVENEENNLSNS